VTTARLVPLLLLALKPYPFATLTPAAASVFDRYTASAEAETGGDVEGGTFLEIDRNPEGKAKLRAGAVSIEPATAPAEIKAPGGMIQDWRGTIFIPHSTISQVRAVLQDYDNYKQFYKPNVIESHIIAHQSDDYDIFLRLYKKQVITIVLNSEYHVRYRVIDPRRMSVISRSTRIAEVKDPDRSLTEAEQVGHDTGSLWRLNSYWRFEEADGGVYAECRAISLSRDIPLALGWMIKGFVAKFPKESMRNTLAGTKAAVEHQSSF
jgi:hypothetical protein